VLKRKLAVAIGLGLAAVVVAASAACAAPRVRIRKATKASHAGGEPDVVIDVSLKNLRFTPDAVEVAAGQTVQVNVTTWTARSTTCWWTDCGSRRVGEATAGTTSARPRTCSCARDGQRSRQHHVPHEREGNVPVLLHAARTQGCGMVGEMKGRVSGRAGAERRLSHGESDRANTVRVESRWRVLWRCSS